MLRYIQYFVGIILGIFFFSFAFGADTTAPKADCTSNTSLCSPSFTIQLDDFSFANDIIGGTSKETVNNLIGRVIQLLMVLLGVVSLAIMTIGAGYMIIHHGDDELLSRGKGIFTAGIASLFIALSAYYLVDFVGYVLYK